MALIICSIFVPIITIKICPKEEKILILSNFYSINPSKWPKLYNIVRKGRNFAQFWSHCSCSRHQKLSNWPQCPTYNKQITRVCLNLDTNAWLFDFPVKLAAILFKQQRRHLLLMAIFLGAKKLNEFQFGDFYCLSLLLFLPSFARYRFNRFPVKFFRKKICSKWEAVYADVVKLFLEEMWKM